MAKTKEKEIEEILKATFILNKYRNFYYSSGDEKEVRLCNMINDFLPNFHKELIEDELVRLVIEKINQSDGEFKIR